VRQGVVGQALALGDGIRLSTLAAYARAAGWRVLVEVRWRGRHEDAPVGVAAADDLDDTVAQARALAEAWGLELSLAVEPGETCVAFSVSFGECQRDKGHDGKHRRGRSEWR
jgi:hypothetical protein